ncbi:MAG: methylglyoxal synthase [Clostridia bacterium]|nr:methylglyoxal synthase [Clostridia bacterium]
MNIALIADEKKKELMVQFCIAYAGILSKHNIGATATTANLIAEATGMEIQRFLSGTQGGADQIAARISCDDVDIMLYFRDPSTPSKLEREENLILRLCDVHNVPVATNIATAEVIIMALDRGDLDWRMYINK